MAHQHHDHSSHDHGGHDHTDHDHDDENSPAVQSLIWKQIEFTKIRTLNESRTDAGRQIIEKSWQRRLDAGPQLSSDTDEQLLIFVPYSKPFKMRMFAGVLKLHAILIRASTSASCPRTLNVYLNNEDLDFSAASDQSPTQSLVISQTNEVQELPVRRALFGNTYNLSLFIEDNYGESVSEIFWIGFKGEFTQLNREPFEVLYEKAANPKDHEMIAGIGERGALGGQRHGM